MRMLASGNLALDLAKLGFEPRQLEVFKKGIYAPNGLVLVTGPTGSGKTTTLYSALAELNTITDNISTAEDPVEYNLEGINQTQVNKDVGLTFASVLRALLRQDPDTILVGEIRDYETAEVSIQAALTGHLVFSTLHTNNAATCLPRLLDMGIEPFLIASVVRVVIGQRLVRRLVADDCEAYEPSQSEIKEIERVFGLKSKQDWENIVKLMQSAQETFGKPKTTKIQLYRPKANLPQDHTGYKGRMGIYEVLKNTTDVQKMIVGAATSEEIQNQAIKEGMLTMQLDGLIKALLGMTSIEEILRVTRE
jgi:type IV pilus assembly protein PilB